MLDLLKAISDFEENPQAGRYHEILANFNDFIELKDYCEQFPNDQNISGVFRLYMKYGYQYLARTIEAFRNNEQRHDVVITTVHKAKGREWDNVLLADDFEGRSFSEDMLQRVKINGDPEARLLYVAITRAKRGLYGAYIEPLIKFLSRYSFDKPLPTDNQEISDLVEENEQEEGDQLTPAKEAKT
ncbi:ATP-binding domain-containing protein, partial [Mycobacterium tuberculosis]|nr:ATP-binding domain-containing protein [Mycobacterium tuberculosis]